MQTTAHPFTVSAPAILLSIALEPSEAQELIREYSTSKVGHFRYNLGQQINDVLVKRLTLPDAIVRSDTLTWTDPQSPETAHHTHPDAAGLKTPVDRLRAVLCNPDGECDIAGSDADREIIDKALTELELKMLSRQTLPVSPRFQAVLTGLREVIQPGDRFYSHERRALTDFIIGRCTRHPANGPLSTAILKWTTSFRTRPIGWFYEIPWDREFVSTHPPCTPFAKMRANDGSVDEAREDDISPDQFTKQIKDIGHDLGISPVMMNHHIQVIREIIRPPSNRHLLTILPRYLQGERYIVPGVKKQAPPHNTELTKHGAHVPLPSPGSYSTPSPDLTDDELDTALIKLAEDTREPIQEIRDYVEAVKDARIPPEKSNRDLLEQATHVFTAPALAASTAPGDLTFDELEASLVNLARATGHDLHVIRRYVTARRGDCESNTPNRWLSEEAIRLFNAPATAQPIDDSPTAPDLTDAELDAELVELAIGLPVTLDTLRREASTAHQLTGVFQSMTGQPMPPRQLTNRERLAIVRHLNGLTTDQ